MPALLEFGAGTHEEAPEWSSEPSGTGRSGASGSSTTVSWESPLGSPSARPIQPLNDSFKGGAEQYRENQKLLKEIKKLGKFQSYDEKGEKCRGRGVGRIPQSMPARDYVRRVDALLRRFEDACAPTRDPAVTQGMQIFFEVSCTREKREKYLTRIRELHFRLSQKFFDQTQMELYARHRAFRNVFLSADDSPTIDPLLHTARPSPPAAPPIPIPVTERGPATGRSSGSFSPASTRRSVPRSPLSPHSFAFPSSPGR